MARPQGVSTVAGELAVLERRFATSGFRCERGEDGDTHILIVLEPSDPQWPAFLGIRAVPVQIQLAATYPHTAPLLSVAGGPVPEAIADYIDAQLLAHVAGHRANCADPSLVFVLREYLRWLDRMLEPLFLQAMRAEKDRRDAALLTFIPAKQHQQGPRKIEEPNTADVIYPKSKGARSTAADKQQQK